MSKELDEIKEELLFEVKNSLYEKVTDYIEYLEYIINIIKENLNIDEILLAVKGVCKASDYELLKEVLK